MPSTIGAMSALRTLTITNNGTTSWGQIPSQLSNLVNIERIVLNNGFTGTLDVFSPLQRLIHLHV